MRNNLKWSLIAGAVLLVLIGPLVLWLIVGYDSSSMPEPKQESLNGLSVVALYYEPNYQVNQFLKPLDSGRPGVIAGDLTTEKTYKNTYLLKLDHSRGALLEPFGEKMIFKHHATEVEPEIFPFLDSALALRYSFASVDVQTDGSMLLAQYCRLKDGKVEFQKEHTDASWQDYTPVFGINGELSLLLNLGSGTSNVTSYVVDASGLLAEQDLGAVLGWGHCYRDNRLSRCVVMQSGELLVYDSAKQSFTVQTELSKLGTGLASLSPGSMFKLALAENFAICETDIRYPQYHIVNEAGTVVTLETTMAGSSPLGQISELNLQYNYGKSSRRHHRNTLRSLGKRASISQVSMDGLVDIFPLSETEVALHDQGFQRLLVFSEGP